MRAQEQAKEIRDAKGDDPLVTRLASQGYVVVGSDYLGLGKSNYAYHPYLHSASEASATIDAMRAARSVLQHLKTPLSGKVMLSGYSQGGHTAMATQREIEAHLSKEFHLVASAPISGPYALEQTFLDSWSGSNAVGENTFGILLGSYAIVAMQHTYKNIYLEPGQVFQDPWAAKVEPLFPGKQSLTDMFLNDTLPSIDKVKSYFQPGFYSDFPATRPTRSARIWRATICWSGRRKPRPCCAVRPTMPLSRSRMRRPRSPASSSAAATRWRWWIPAPATPATTRPSPIC